MNTIMPPGFGDGTGGAGGGLLGLSQRVPPQSPQAEQALLGALLANNKAYEQVSEFLAPEHFADPVHGRIFRAIQRRVEAGQLADVVTLRPEFEHSGDARRGGRPRLPGAAPLGHDRHHQRRRVRPPGPRLLAAPPARGRGRGGGEPRLRRRGRARRQGAARSRRAAPVRSVQGRRRRVAASSPSSAPWPTRCWPPSAPSPRPAACPACPRACATSTPRPAACTAPTCMILAGRPGMGKTALATKIAFGAARALVREAQEKGPNTLPKGVAALFSLEMSADQLATRLLAEESAHLRRPHPPRRHLPARLRPLRGGEPRDGDHADRHRRHAGHHHLGAAHPLPPPEAHARAGAGGGRLPPAHAPRRRHPAGKPGAGDLA